MIQMEILPNSILRGNVEAALYIILSDDKPTEDNDETYTKQL